MRIGSRALTRCGVPSIVAPVCLQKVVFRHNVYPRASTSVSVRTPSFREDVPSLFG